MAYVDMVRSHVERLLQDEFELCRVKRDADGDYPLRCGSAVYFVRVMDADPVVVNVFSAAVSGVKRSAKLLEEINSVNSRAVFGRAYWLHGTVFVEHTLLATSLDRETLGRACSAVGTIADDVGPMIALVYGGVTALPASEREEAVGTGS